MSLQNWHGSRWWKCDLHTHTPASDDYGKGADQAVLKGRTPHDWLLDHMRAGIDCVAVTDHNSGAWIDCLRDALAELELNQPDDYHPLHLFTGVEISVQGGVHLLAILPSGTTTSAIDTLLGAIGFAGAKGSCGDVTNRPFGDVVQAIAQLGGIAIPAHVDRENGLFRKFHGSTLAQALGGGHIFAMETADSACAKPQLYNDKKLRWTAILGSDSHHPAGEPGQRFPGSHFTWVKMGSPDLDGLRLALLDGPLSVRRSDDFPETPKGAALLRRRPEGLLPAARQELLDPSKAWWGGRRGRLADRPRYSISVSLGVVPLVLPRREVPVRIEVAAGFVAPGASEPPRLQPSWPPGGFGPAHG